MAWLFVSNLCVYVCITLHYSIKFCSFVENANKKAASNVRDEGKKRLYLLLILLFHRRLFFYCVPLLLPEHIAHRTLLSTFFLFSQMFCGLAHLLHSLSIIRGNSFVGRDDDDDDALHIEYVRCDGLSLIIHFFFVLALTIQTIENRFYSSKILLCTFSFHLFFFFVFVCSIQNSF